MNRSASLLFVASLLSASAQIPAFPGAEGFGAFAKGGRGGDVYIVTSLESSGPGSFQEGIAKIPSGGRTIVFAVSGQIHLAGGNRTRIVGKSLTIAGQTAPGDGILFRDGSLRISAEDVIIRHLRFRHGKGGSGGDCIDLDSQSKNTILDSISTSFSTDENISSFKRPPENVTLQWSINSWGLESHSCGGLWDQGHGTCHHSLWAHNHTRNPKARPIGLLEWTNNVIFDWDIGMIMGDSPTPAEWKANVIGNYYICPPGNIRKTPLEKAGLDRDGKPNFAIYVSNNLHDMNGNSQLDGENRGWQIVQGTPFVPGKPSKGNYIRMEKAFPGSTHLVIEEPVLAYKKVLSKSGPQRLDFGYAGILRDEVDTRVMENVAELRKNHISRESDLQGVSNKGFGTFAPAEAPEDIDKDGMPDVYESSLGWNPKRSDNNAEIHGASFFPTGTPSGYTALEEYLHFMSVPHLFLVNGGVTMPEIDLSRYTSGFTKSPKFVLSSITGGAAIQGGEGGKLVRFKANEAGRAGFLFTVTDADGSSWTQQFAVCVTGS